MLAANKWLGIDHDYRDTTIVEAVPRQEFKRSYASVVSDYQRRPQPRWPQPRPPQYPARQYGRCQ
jgi:hypothetical protein